MQMAVVEFARNVLGITDANSLELWLELCPTVSAWFAEIMGKHISGIQDIYRLYNQVPFCYP